MEAAMIELCKQIPAVAALIFLVIQFLRSLEKRDETLNKIRQEWTDGMSSAMKSSSEVIDRNTDAMLQVYGIISKCPKIASKDN